MRRLCLMITATLVLLNVVSTAALAHSPVESYGPSTSREEDLVRETPCDAPADLWMTRRWIEVSLEQHVVRLCEGPRAWREYLAATGIGDHPDTTTFPGLFTIYEMNLGPLHLSEYDVFVTDWIGFDREHHNGFHSLPLDATGRVLDDRIGQAASHGCVRTHQSSQIREFAEFGMSVWVH